MQRYFPMTTDAKERVCKICGETYPLTAEFWPRNKESKDGLRQPCKKCKYEQDRLYREANAERCHARSREYYRTHKEQHHAYGKAWKETHKESVKESGRKFFQKHKEEIYAKYGKQNQAYIKQRKAVDPVFKLSLQIRVNIYDAFKRRGCRKDSRCAEITGLSAPDLANYLVETFRNNYGREWDGVEAVHIDHIIPLATAESIDDVKRLCHYTNLQLLTAEDNLRKNAKLDYELTTPQERM